MSTAITYDRPVEATLVVRLANGETFDAGPEDLAKFGYVERHAVYERVVQSLRLAAGLTDDDLELTQIGGPLNALRYIMENAVFGYGTVQEYVHYYEGTSTFAPIEAWVTNAVENGAA